MLTSAKRIIATGVLIAFTTQSLMFSIPSFADDRTFADLVKNTKEAESILLIQDEVDEAEVTFPADDAQVDAQLRDAFKSLAAGLNGITPCEPLVLSRLQAELKNQNLSSESDSVRQALLLLRKKNLIDDVTLMPLLAAFPAWLNLGYRESDWVRKDPEGRTLQIDCPTDQFLQLVGSVRSELGRKTHRGDFIRRIKSMAKEQNDRKEPRYLPIQIQWLTELNRNEFDDETSFSLPQVLKEVAASKDTSPRANPADDTPSKVMSKKKKKSGGLSNRLALYAKFNSLQINILTDLFKKFTERMAAQSVQIVIKYGDGKEDETYDLSPQEQYRMAAKMLHKDIEELKLSSLFQGRGATFDEVIIAGLETGFIHSKELDAAMGVDDLWNPNVSFWKKALNIMKKYGSTVLILIPSPVSFWAGLVITLTETVISKSTDGPGNADDNGISIF